MLQELGFHKCAIFTPLPELYAAKFSPEKLERISGKLQALASKHDRQYMKGYRFMLRENMDEVKPVLDAMGRSNSKRNHFLDIKDVIDRARQG